MKTDGEMGSLAWGYRNDGTLDWREKGQMISNIARIQTRHVMDHVLSTLALTRPGILKMENFELPDTKLVQDAIELATTMQTPALLHHCWRTLYFGMAIGHFEQIDFDPELLTAAVLMHDLGLTDDPQIDPIHGCCFAIGGAKFAKDKLEALGHAPSCSNHIGEAIALHLNMRISPKDHGGDAYLLSRGAVCDVLGLGRKRIHTDLITEILRHHPRDGVYDALRIIDGPHHPNSRAYFTTRLFGGKLPPDPFKAYADATGG